MIKILKITLITTAILIITTVLYWQRNKQVSSGELVFRKSFIFDRQKIYIEQYKDDKTVTFLVKRDWLAWPDSIKLRGFEDDVVPCNQNIFSQNIPDSICLIGYVGAHSQNIQFINIDNSKFSPIQILHENGEEDENLISDNPRFSVAKKDETLFLYADQRDYDSNPLDRVIRSSYVYHDNKIIFDKKITLQYNSN